MTSLTNKSKTQLQPHQRLRALFVSIRPSLIHGKGLFALHTFAPGDTICRSEGYVVNVRTRELESWESRISYQLSANQHFIPTGVVNGTINSLANVNHSCNPNSYVQFDQKSKILVLKSLKKISKDDEITCDYCITESEIACPFSCRCGMDNCRGFVGGTKFK